MEKTVFELSEAGRRSYSLPADDIQELKIESLIPPSFVRMGDNGLPSLSELEIVRHFTRLSQLNFSIDSHFYPKRQTVLKYEGCHNQNEKGTRTIMPWKSRR